MVVNILVDGVSSFHFHGTDASTLLWMDNVFVQHPPTVPPPFNSAMEVSPLNTPHIVWVVWLRSFKVFELLFFVFFGARGGVIFSLFDLFSGNGDVVAALVVVEFVGIGLVGNTQLIVVVN